MGDIPEPAEGEREVAVGLGGVQLLGQTLAKGEGVLVVGAGGGQIPPFLGDIPEPAEGEREVTLGVGVRW